MTDLWSGENYNETQEIKGDKSNSGRHLPQISTDDGKEWVKKDRISATWGFPGSSDGKASASNPEDLGSITGLRRAPGEGNGYLLQYSCLKNSTDRGVWQATVHGVTKQQDITEQLTLLLSAILYGLK